MKPGAARPMNSGLRVRKHRENLSAQGLRPIQLWVLDTRKRDVRERLKSDCERVNNSPDEREVMEWLEGVRDTSGWT